MNFIKWFLDKLYENSLRLLDTPRADVGTRKKLHIKGGFLVLIVSSVVWLPVFFVFWLGDVFPTWRNIFDNAGLILGIALLLIICILIVWILVISIREVIRRKRSVAHYIERKNRA